VNGLTPRIITLGLLGLAAGAVVAFVLLASTTYEPTIAGVVVRRDAIDGSTTRFVLDGGEVVDADLVEARIVRGGSLPDIGDLLLAGSGTRPWIARLVDHGSGCYWAGGRGTEDGERIRLPDGLVLPKAEDFDRAHYHETEREFNGAGFCVDASGAVTSVR
jgi:hypothetical protein